MLFEDSYASSEERSFYFIERLILTVEDRVDVVRVRVILGLADSFLRLC